MRVTADQGSRKANPVSFRPEMNAVVTILIVLLIRDGRSQRCGEGNGSCRRENCCSAAGWCEFATFEHCGIRCQPDYGWCFNLDHAIRYGLAILQQCGSQTLLHCPRPLCCSKFGYCGSTDEHCGTGCQEEYGVCSNPAGRCPIPAGTQKNWFFPLKPIDDSAANGDSLYEFCEPGYVNMKPIRPRECRNGQWSSPSNPCGTNAAYKRAVGINGSHFVNGTELNDGSLATCQLLSNEHREVQIDLDLRVALNEIHIIFKKEMHYDVTVRVWDEFDGRPRQQACRRDRAPPMSSKDLIKYNESIVFPCLEHERSKPARDVIRRYVGLTLGHEAHVCEVEVSERHELDRQSLEIPPKKSDDSQFITIVIVVISISLVLIATAAVVICICRRRGRNQPFYGAAWRRHLPSEAHRSSVTETGTEEPVYDTIYGPSCHVDGKVLRVPSKGSDYEDPTYLRDCPPSQSSRPEYENIPGRPLPERPQKY